MPSRTLDEHIEHQQDATGENAHIRGHRITVQDVAIWHERLGRSADEIATEHDVTLADVYAALAYYFDHRDDIDRRIADDQALAQSLRERTPSKVAEKLRSLHGKG